MPDHHQPLLGIIARARAGAIDQAWGQLVAAGYDRAQDDPAALTVKGRLLKDRAARETGAAAAAELYAEAAAAYDRAAQINGATYPLINAATLTLLAGDPEGAEVRARGVLDHVAAHPDEPETPYYRAATRAEALLLAGDGAEARAAMAEAVSLAPQAWEDHATTLRQFALILKAQGGDAAWLDPLRPPRSMHFGGHMSFRAGSNRESLTRHIADLIGRERIGFGYGALAAGADIIVAEALIASGAELHLVLPGGPEAFAALSVDPFGAAWRKRYDLLVAKAATVRSVEILGEAPDAASIGLADEVAMGEAIINARLLESAAVQLLVLDPDDMDANRSRRLWQAAGVARAQHLVEAPRELAGTPPPAVPVDSGQALAVVAIGFGGGDRGAGLERLKILFRATRPAIAPALAGDVVIAAFESVADAACLAAAAAAIPEAEAQVGGYFGVAECVDDPFSGAMRIAGRAHAAALAVCTSALPGSVMVSDDFAAGLAVADPGFAAEFVGELDRAGSAQPMGLYALRKRS